MSATEISAALQKIADGYRFSSPAITLGAAMESGRAHPQVPVSLPLSMLTRHGLICGATGTGKTITLQVLAEQLSAQGVPVFLADIKGDLSGLAQAAEPSTKLQDRVAALGLDLQYRANPVQFLSLGDDPSNGVPVRASVDSFGPILLARVMELNETQESCLQLIFHYADQRELPLDDLGDLRTVITHLLSPAGKADLATLGGVSQATAAVLLRGLSVLEAQGVGRFFGQPEFDTADLMRLSPESVAVINCLELPSVQRQPLLFSTFLMWLLADLFEGLAEVGDLDKPKLVFFFDEAHLLFKDASKAFLGALINTVRLIRSKGVGVFFVTQSASDIPEEILAQIGNRIQHAMRVITPKDAAALKSTISTFPITDWDLGAALTQAGVGEAVISVLNERGVPTPVAWTRLRAPGSRMGALESEQLDRFSRSSPLYERYALAQNRASASEMLQPATGTAATSPVTLPLPEEPESFEEEARRIEESILGTASPGSSRPERKTPSTGRTRELDPAAEANPLLDLALQTAHSLGQEFLRGMFGTRRRRRRR